MPMNLGVAEARLSLDIADFIGNAKTAEGAMTSLEGSARRTDGFLGGLGRGFVNFGSAMIAPMALGLKTAVDLEQQLANVNASLGGIDTSKLKEIEQGFLDIGSASKFGAVEVGAVGDELARAGFNEDQLIATTQTVVDLAQATGDGLDPSTQAVTASMNLWNEANVGTERSIKDVTRVADVFTVAANASTAGVAELNAGVRNLAPAVSLVRLGFEESTAAIAFYTNRGIKAADAGVSLTRGIQDLMDTAQDSPEVLEALGISAFDMEGNFVGLPSLFDQLQTATAGMTDEQRALALSTIFGAESIDVMAIAAKEGAGPLLEILGLMEENGVAAEQSAIRMDTLGAQFGELAESVTNFLASLVSGLLPGLRLFVDMANQVVDVLAQIPGPIKTALGAFLGLAAGVAAVVRSFQAFRAINTLLGGAGAARGGLFGLGALGPIMLGVAAVAGVALLAIKTNFLGIGEAVRVGVAAFEFFDQAGTKVGATLKAIAAALRSFDVGFLHAMADGFDAAGFAIDAFWNAFMGGGGQEVEKATKSLEGFATQLEDGSWIIEATPGDYEAGIGHIGEIIDSWKNADGTVDVVIETEGGEQITTTIDMITGFVEDEYETEVTIDGEDARDTITRIIDGFDGMTASLEKSAFPALARFPRAAAGVLRSADRLTESFRYYRRMGLDPVNAGLAAIGREFPQFADEAQAAQRVVNDVTTSFQDFREQGVGPVSAALLAVGDTFPSIERAMQGLADVTTGLGEAFQDAIRGDWAGAFEGLEQAARGAWAVVQEILGGIGGLVVDLFNWTINTGIPAITGWIADNAGDVGRAILTAAGWVWDNIIVPIGSITLQVAGWLVESVDSVWESIKAWVLGKGSGVGGAGGAFGGAAARAAGGSIPIGAVAVMISGWIVDAAQSIWDAIQNFVIGGGSASGGISDAERRSGAPMGGGQVTLDSVMLTIGGWEVVADAQGVWDAINTWVDEKITVTDAEAAAWKPKGEEIGRKIMATILDVDTMFAGAGAPGRPGATVGGEGGMWRYIEPVLDGMWAEVESRLDAWVTAKQRQFQVWWNSKVPSLFAFDLEGAMGGITDVERRSGAPMGGRSTFGASIIEWFEGEIERIQQGIDAAWEAVTFDLPAFELPAPDMPDLTWVGDLIETIRTVIDLIPAAWDGFWDFDLSVPDISIPTPTLSWPEWDFVGEITAWLDEKIGEGVEYAINIIPTFNILPNDADVQADAAAGTPVFDYDKDIIINATGDKILTGPGGMPVDPNTIDTADLIAADRNITLPGLQFEPGDDFQWEPAENFADLLSSRISGEMASIEPIALNVPLDITFTGGDDLGGSGGGARGFGGGGGLFSDLVTQAQTALQTITVAVTTQSAAWGTILGASGAGIGAALSLAFSTALTAAQTALQSITTAVTTHSSAWAVIVGAQGSAMASAASAATAAMLGAIQTGFQSATTAVTTHAQAWATIVAASGATMAASAAAAAAAVSASLAAGMAAATAAVQANASRWPGIIAATGGAMAAAGFAAGAAAGQGVAAGMLSALGSIQAAANQIIATVDTALRSAAQIASPSKLTAYIGQMLGLGMYGGMIATLPLLSSAAGAMTSAATPYLPATGAMGGGSSHTSINAPVSVNATINGGDGWSAADQKRFAREFAVAIRDGVEIEYTSRGAQP